MDGDGEVGRSQGYIKEVTGRPVVGVGCQGEQSRVLGKVLGIKPDEQLKTYLTGVRPMRHVAFL